MKKRATQIRKSIQVPLLAILSFFLQPMYFCEQSTGIYQQFNCHFEFPIRTAIEYGSNIGEVFYLMPFMFMFDYSALIKLILTVILTMWTYHKYSKLIIKKINFMKDTLLWNIVLLLGTWVAASVFILILSAIYWHIFPHIYFVE